MSSDRNEIVSLIVAEPTQLRMSIRFEAPRSFVTLSIKLYGKLYFRVSRLAMLSTVLVAVHSLTRSVSSLSNRSIRSRSWLDASNT